jgi:hypothetical protein
MRALLLGVSLLALAVPAAYAQQPVPPMPGTAPGPMESRTYEVYFEFNQSRLTAEGRRTVAEAAEEYRRTGAARIVVSGHTDTVGSPSYNERLSERRAETVRGELVRLGVPADLITTIGMGERDLAVPTGEGVREARNRRVEIVIERPAVAAAPEPAPVVAAAPPPAAPPPRPAPRNELLVGGFYGHNYRETDDDTESDLGGAELSLNHYLTPNVLLSLDQAGFYAFNSVNDGWGGRTAVGIDLQGNWGRMRPYIGLNVGGVYGRGVQDGFIAGPELGLKVDVAENTFLYGRVAYDYQFRNNWEDWDDFDRGLLMGGAGIGFRF